jgi:hypothetical protein
MGVIFTFKLETMAGRERLEITTVVFNAMEERDLD